MTDEDLFHQCRKAARLPADENKNPRGEREYSGDNGWDGDREERDQSDNDEINGKQQHADVLCEVHADSILIAQSRDNPNLA
jgi:hypothetical protein